MFGDFEGLLTIVGLGNEEVIDIDTQLFGVATVEGVLGVDEGGEATGFLGFGNGVQGKRGFTRRFGAVYFNDPAAWKATYTQGKIETK